MKPKRPAGLSNEFWVTEDCDVQEGQGRQGEA